MAVARGEITMILTDGVTGVMKSVGAASDTAQAFLISKLLDLGDSLAIKALDEMRVEIDKQAKLGNATLELDFTDELDKPLTSGEVLQLIDAPGPFPVHPEDAAYYRIKVIDVALADLWKLSKIELYGAIVARKT